MDSIFESYQECLDEALSTIYPYKWKSQNEKKGSAVFRTNDNREITVDIWENTRTDTHVLDFVSTDKDNEHGFSMGITGKGDAFKILATVLSIATEYVTKYINEIDVFEFTAEKPGNHRRRGESGREKIYTRLFKKYDLPGKWDKEIHKKGYETTFVYTKVG